ncbi:hypothetical protein J6590_063284 [Homalodisca vitripennis]|nr:hypothetical protein J6590_063284 [Homalodisca vitripennis]
MRITLYDFAERYRTIYIGIMDNYDGIAEKDYFTSGSFNKTSSHFALDFHPNPLRVINSSTVNIPLSPVSFIQLGVHVCMSDDWTLWSLKY